MTDLKGKFGLAGALLALCLNAPATAHHSFAMFDHAKHETLQGTVKNYNWTNPHMSIEILAPKPEGGPRLDWTIEGPSVSMLVRNGWTRSLMKPGDEITLTMNPLKSGVPGGSLMTVTVAGKTLIAH